jgi:hypothetical protein
MPLRNRILRVTLSLPSGDFVMDEGLDLHVHIHKAALVLQNSATINVVGLSTTMRQKLLTQFTAWHKRLVETGQTPQDWIDVKIEAGYSASAASFTSGRQGLSNTTNTSVIFLGQVAGVDITSGPPNIGVRISCYSRQIDKRSYGSEPQISGISYKQYVFWAAQQMNLGTNVDCETSHDNDPVDNPAASILTADDLLVDIQNRYRPDVAAFVDDNKLIVRDRGKILNPSQTAILSEFIDTPMWTEWGVTFKTLFDPTVKLAQGAQITSIMNGGVNGQGGVNGVYVVMELEYSLASRSTDFYVKGGGSPSA